MFEYKGTDKFDIGEGFGEYEYDFFTINSEDDFWVLINHYGYIHKHFKCFLDGYDVTENNERLSPFVQLKMKEYGANISITFLADKCIKNNMCLKRMIVNELKQDEYYNTYYFYFLLKLG